MLEELFTYQNKMLRSINDRWYRYAYRDIDWQERLFGIKGLRGVGKTTLMLQHLKYHYPHKEQALYVSADHPWFYVNTLFDLITEFDKIGGRLLMIDEIHKYPRWSSELKAGYDANQEIQFIFSASSAFDLHQAEADLCRRATVRLLPGLSFREYLEFRHGIKADPFSLDDLFSKAGELSHAINEIVKPLPLFKEYLAYGYFPFIRSLSDEAIEQKLTAIVHTVLENDLAYVQDYSPSNIQKIKKLLGVIAGTAPFTPNISRIANKLQVGRNTIYNYLKHLEDAHILNLLHKSGRGISILQKPDKIYFENSNLATAFNSQPEIGALRETFFVNQIRNAGYTIHLANKGDFIVEGEITVEVGGKNKTARQISELDRAYLAKADTEYAFGNSIPLWMFGFLY
ncbi:MAG: AAA family ATPase [Bacteroidetes bacterium]|jgi:predicted AAA+ superfamily ATPase|nr:AAA family ATPase [Bacteroidota bacterium]